MPGNMMPASMLYVKELLPLGHGCPNWKPEPLLRDGSMMVGDVGYVREGGFKRLFNAKASQDNIINRRGVPVDFRPISLDDSEMLEIPGDLTADIYTSKSVVRHKVGLGVSSDVAASGGSCALSCASEHGAALAFFPSATYRGSQQLDVFKRYYQKNWRSWFHFANEKGLGVRPDEIILVYGLHQTASWANACFTSKDKSASITLNGGVPPLAQAGFSLHGSWSQRTSVEHRSGPMPSIRVADGLDAPSISAFEVADKALEMNQTIFFKSVQMAIRLGPFTTLRAAAEPTDDTWSDSDDDDTSREADLRSINSDRSDGSSSSGWASIPELEDDSSTASGDLSDGDLGSLFLEDGAVEIRSNPSMQRTPLPCDSLLGYILETSNADYAIACDDDVQALSQSLSAQDCRLSESPQDTLSDPSILDLIRTHCPFIEVDDDGCGTLSVWNSSVPDTIIPPKDEIATAHGSEVIPRGEPQRARELDVLLAAFSADYKHAVCVSELVRKCEASMQSNDGTALKIGVSDNHVVTGDASHCKSINTFTPRSTVLSDIFHPGMRPDPAGQRSRRRIRDDLIAGLQLPLKERREGFKDLTAGPRPLKKIIDEQWSAICLYAGVSGSVSSDVDQSCQEKRKAIVPPPLSFSQISRYTEELAPRSFTNIVEGGVHRRSVMGHSINALLNPAEAFDALLQRSCVHRTGQGQSPDDRPSASDTAQLFQPVGTRRSRSWGDLQRGRSSCHSVSRRREKSAPPRSTSFYPSSDVASASARQRSGERYSASVDSSYSRHKTDEPLCTPPWEKITEELISDWHKADILLAFMILIQHLEDEEDCASSTDASPQLH